MEKNIRQYFPGAITHQGYLSYWDTNLADIDQLYILKGGPGTGKATLMRRISKAMAEAGHETELLWCSSDARSLDGVIIREFGLAIMDGTTPHTRDPRYPGVRDMIVDLGRYWQRNILKSYYKEIVDLTDENKALYQEIYGRLKKAKDFAERRRSLYKIRLDEEGLESWLDGMLKEQLKSSTLALGPNRHRFYSIMCPQGVCSFFDELEAQAKGGYCLLTDDLSIGTKVLNYIATKAQGKGCSVWFAHDLYEPEILSALFLPELQLLFYHSNEKPVMEPGVDGEFFRQQCQVVELERWYHKHINGRNELEAEFLASAIEDGRSRAQKLLTENKRVHDRLEAYYVKAMDFDAMEKEKEALMREFLAGGGLALRSPGHR